MLHEVSEKWTTNFPSCFIVIISRVRFPVHSFVRSYTPLFRVRHGKFVATERKLGR